MGGLLGPYLIGGYGFVPFNGAMVVSQPQRTARILLSVSGLVGSELGPPLVTVVTIRTLSGCQAFWNLELGLLIL